MKRGGGNAWLFRAFDRVWGLTFGCIDEPAEKELSLDSMKAEIAPKKRRRRRRGGRNRFRNMPKTNEVAIQQYVAKNARRNRNRIEKEEAAPLKWKRLPVCKDECGRPAGEAQYVARLMDFERLEAYDNFDPAIWPERCHSPKDDTDDRSHARRGSDILKERRRSFYPNRLINE